MSDLILRSFNNKSIRQRADGFFSATDMCQAGGKLFGNWNKTEEAKAYIAVVSRKYYSNQNSSPVESNPGNVADPEKRGTWVDRRVALRLAQWISAEFALQVDEWVEELLATGSVNIGPESEPRQQPRQLAPQRDLIDCLKAAQDLGIDQDPIIKSVLTQRFAEEIGAKASPVEPQPIVLTVRAMELGISQSDIGTGSKLGKFIIAKGFSPAGQTQHGRYKVNCFSPSAALDRAIEDFCCNDLAVAS